LNIIEAFKQVIRKGVVVNAPMRGVRFDLMDIKSHSDSVHRRPSSAVPAAMRAMCGAFLMSVPSLMEPMCRVGIRGKSSALEGVYSILRERGGTVNDTISSSSMDVIISEARLQKQLDEKVLNVDSFVDKL